METTGFQTAAHSPFTLVLNQTARLGFQLQLGALKQTIDVPGGVPLLNTDTMQAGGH